MSKLDTLQEALAAQLGARVKKLDRALGELTLTVAAADYLEAALLLRDHPELKFEQLIDLCGVDYSELPRRALGGPALLRRLAPALGHAQLARCA